MDNLSHSLVSVAVGSALHPKLAFTQKKRFLFTCFAVANLPDIDFILTLWSKEAYIFHHRGFTHSIFGLSLMVPLAYWIISKMLSKEKLQQSHLQPLTFKQKIVFILLQLGFTHYLLDYLTTYGTMFFYPLSMAKFSYPLMFIIDPMFWLICLAGFLALRKQDKNRRKAAVIFLCSIFLYWGVLLGFKKKAENLYTEEKGNIPEHIHSFPGPFSPLLWLILEESQQKFSQGVVAFLKPQKAQVVPIPKQWEQQKLCTSQQGLVTMEQHFKKVLDWGEYVACRNLIQEKQLGCHCISLKYSMLGHNRYNYGAFFLGAQGISSILSRPQGATMDYYKNLLLP